MHNSENYGFDDGHDVVGRFRAFQVILHPGFLMEEGKWPQIYIAHILRYGYGWIMKNLPLYSSSAEDAYEWRDGFSVAEEA